MALQFTLKFLAIGLVWIMAAVVAVVTALPFWDSNIWWIRALDFPRLQIAIAAAVVMVAGLFMPGASRIAVPVLMAAALCYQVARIFPYTVFASPELELAAEGPDQLRVLSTNVLMENDRHDLMLERIRQYDPDILLLMETDQAWLDAMEPALTNYTTVVRQPQDNYYGMIFATRLTASEARIVHLTDDQTPSLFAKLTSSEGRKFRFVGLHPRPPVPGEDTEKRDRQIYYAAKFASSSDEPLVVAGDFNDVAWSDTSRSFKHVGQYLDPRIGRGMYASFDANRWWLRFPIDQLYVTEGIAVTSLQRLDPIGSDHFPMAATLNMDPEVAERLNITPAPISDDEQRLIDKAVAEMRDELGHEEF
ncbi:endonuclease/exonuclease/phosphatase family protein [Paracoccus sp. R86501]|uniref:endonuclease/exonuclease/phosphatase family protein n=1 Tax=Paracoccus sp. R86501 TaxID=3101711 RepID=UPI00366C0FEC